MGSFNSEFRAETWSLYAVGILFILLRLLVRSRKSSGIKGWQIDDWMAFNTAVWYTLLVVSLNKIIFGGGSNFMTPEEQAALTPETRRERIEGSKWVLVSEEAMVCTVWSCKVCMIVIYRRLTEGLNQARLINATAAWVACGFLAVQIALFTNCRPFSGYWSVPAVHDQCWSYYNYVYVEAVFNITADIAMLSIALPMILKVRLPIQQKGPVAVVFGMGVFVIAAAILTKVYCFYPPLLSYEYLSWYCREASVSVYVTNLPIVWGLTRSTFPVLRRWGYKPPASSQPNQPYRFHHDRSQNRTTDTDMQSFDRGGSFDIELTSSENQILDPPSLKIMKGMTFSVEEGPSHLDRDPVVTTSIVYDMSDVYSASSRAHCTAV